MPRPSGDGKGQSPAGEPGSGVRFRQSATVGEWGVAFKNERMTAALLDRLPHRCHILECNGESYRFRQSSKQTKERDAKELTKGLGVRKLSEPTGERLSFWPIGWLPFARRPPASIFFVFCGSTFWFAFASAAFDTPVQVCGLVAYKVQRRERPSCDWADMATAIALTARRGPRSSSSAWWR